MRDFSLKGRYCLLPALLLLGFWAPPVRAEAAPVEPSPAGLRTIEYNITIQANVLRICAAGQFYDFIEADYDGDGPAISPYLVEVVDARGQPLACVAEAEIDPAYGLSKP